MRFPLRTPCVALAALFVGTSALAQSAAYQRFADLAYAYDVVTDVTYLQADGQRVTLDVYKPRFATGPTPTVLFFHGGGWTFPGKLTWPGASSMMFLPLFEMGFTVVNADFRGAHTALAPAAVEDSLCALRWVHRNAKQHNIDATKIITAGNSSGGLLALTSAMIPASAGLDRRCPGNESLSVAAVVSLAGVADVENLLAGPDQQPYAVSWFGANPDRASVARLVSPLTYVRKDLPPILMQQGDKDQPLYQGMWRLHEMLDAAGAPNEFVTTVGAGHTNFTTGQARSFWTAIRAFFHKHGLLPAPPPAGGTN